MVNKVNTPEEEKQRVENLPYSLPIKLRDLLDGFKWANQEKNTSAFIVFDGKSGKGKTTLMGQCAAYCDPDWIDKSKNLSKIHWEPDTFLNGKYDEQGNLIKVGIKQAKQGDFIGFDEGLIFSSRTAMSEVNRMVMVAMSMMRSKKIIVGVCANSIFDLDRNLALSRADLLIHVYGDSLTDRGKFLTFFQAADGQDRIKELFLYGKKFYSYSRPHSNFFATFSGYFVFDEIEYERKKQEGIDIFLASGSKSKSTRDKVFRDRLIYYLREHYDATVPEIAEATGLTIKTIYNGYNAIKEQKEREQ